MKMTVAPKSPMVTVNIPATAPLRKAMRIDSARLVRAAAAQRTLPCTAKVMPIKPVKPEAKQPSRKEIARPKAMPISPPALKNKAMKIMMVTAAMVRNCRRK